MTNAARYVTDFDSSTTMLFTLASCLKNEEFKGSGVASKLPAFSGHILNSFPEKMREAIYRAAGWFGAITEDKLSLINSEDIASWVLEQYPKKKYPGIMIGSSNGGLTHLAAALGIPWLPQTYLLTIRRKMHADEMEKDAEWGKEMVKHFLPQNHDLLAYQMHDPLQDRLMVQEMGYFRLKRVKLGKAWENFIKENVEPGGIIYTSECNYRWMIYRLGDRHTFQIGGLGGLTSKQYLEGSPDIDAFIAAYGGKITKWGLPGEPFEGEEAEWGFSPGLLEDIERFAKENGYRVQRICYTDPEDVSGFVADLYRWWYEKMNWDTGRLLCECFALMDPLLCFKTESIPFWLAFNTQCSLKSLKNYLESAQKYRDIYLILMSNAVKNAIGLVSYAEWRTAIKQAQRQSAFIAVNEAKYPADLATFLHYREELKQKIGYRREVPTPLSHQDFEAFLTKNKDIYPLRWLGAEATSVS